jgi:hypothetical protein
MPCKYYKDALIESAASGAQPHGDLRAHLAGCVSCRAAFAQEQALFSSIDTGLHVTANAEMPGSLLPRVRARLVEAAAPRRMSTPNWFALAGATAMVVAFVAARAVWHANVERNPSTTSVQTNSPGSVVPPLQNSVSPSVPLPTKESLPPSRSTAVRNPAQPERPAIRNAMPEVLVLHDQEVLLVSYAEQWRQRKRPRLMAEESDEKALLPLQVAPIQIAQLDVKLLAEEQSQ